MTNITREVVEKALRNTNPLSPKIPLGRLNEFIEFRNALDTDKKKNSFDFFWFNVFDISKFRVIARKKKEQKTILGLFT